MKFIFDFTHGLDGIHTSYTWTLDEARAGLAELNAVHNDTTDRQAILARVNNEDGTPVEPNEFNIVTLTDGDDSLTVGVAPHTLTW